MSERSRVTWRYKEYLAEVIRGLVTCLRKKNIYRGHRVARYGNFSLVTFVRLVASCTVIVSEILDRMFALSLQAFSGWSSQFSPQT